MSSECEKKPLDTPLAEGTPSEKSLRQLAEDFFFKFLIKIVNRTEACINSLSVQMTC